LAILPVPVDPTIRRGHHDSEIVFFRKFQGLLPLSQEPFFVLLERQIVRPDPETVSMKPLGVTEFAIPYVFLERIDGIPDRKGVRRNVIEAFDILIGDIVQYFRRLLSVG
jgi:hypothetical protein